METKNNILKQTKKLFAEKGFSGLSMRDLALNSKITLSVIYHYFPDKETLLKSLFDEVNHELGVKRKQLPRCQSASELLWQRIEFQIDNAEDIVYILKYYLNFRNKFPAIQSGHLPDKAYLHIEEVLIHGVETGEFKVENLKKDAKIIAHAINGFVLEYYPSRVKCEEKNNLVKMIHSFLLRALTK